ncbi:hypothetical protein GCM10010954_28640 [Halobacillus andaensis]|uniref:Uncharacterized protein n=1 Tax=Halobacillus andaensis TaxID=1176239 RepID=A0A917B9Z1_HALAA|nr:hypothetical protein [Halobacillus andaensis]MBP2006496.1 hypothetical protein [Halobacillus andaensis]GGF27792.1 hypothetical protein GCM10010954_28640 [Halobacillus andaensis]
MEVQINQEDRYEQAFNKLNNAKPYAKRLYQNDLFQETSRLARSFEGVQVLYRYADQFDQAGVFEGGPWEDPSKLQPNLVNLSLRIEGIESIVTLLSELRMLSIAQGRYEHEKVSADMAKAYLNEVMALNLDFIFPEESEEARIERSEETDRAENLFKLLVEEMTLVAVSGTLLEEINRLTAQRPIMVNRILLMIQKAEQLLHSDVDEDKRKEIQRYHDATSQLTPISQEFPKFSDYRNKLKEMTDKELEKESKAFGQSMRETGLVSPYHVVLVRFLNCSKAELVPAALFLNEKGAASLSENAVLVNELIKVAIHLPTRQSLYGLARMLERGVLSHHPVAPGLRRLVELDIKPDMAQTLLEAFTEHEGITANNVMVAGVLSVLGQPLGIGQGLNPTCQSARALSLWSIHDPGYLLEQIPRAARDGDITMTFEGQAIHSKNLTGGLAPDLHKELDPVSLILVPHLDRIYAEMINRVQFRGDDPHRWVNPPFYGDWVPRGFGKVFDHLTSNITDYGGFVRLFYATHHPDYNEGHELIYPNPVGICVTTVYGKMLGFHAITIQRVAKDPKGEYRVYFYNPNNDSSQNWGQGIEPKVKGNGEYEGESSLPFHEFVSRLYAFHFNPYEQGDASSVEDEVVEKIETLARESWGQEYLWIN